MNANPLFISLPSVDGLHWAQTASSSSTAWYFSLSRHFSNFLNDSIFLFPSCVPSYFSINLSKFSFWNFVASNNCLNNFKYLFALQYCLNSNSGSATFIFLSPHGYPVTVMSSGEYSVANCSIEIVG